MNEIFNEDCYKTLTKRDIEYDYVTLVMYWEELDMEAYRSGIRENKNLAEKIYKKLNPKSGVVTIVNSMRKHKRFSGKRFLYLLRMFNNGINIILSVRSG